jgi:hypothetical protein
MKTMNFNWDGHDANAPTEVVLQRAYNLCLKISELGSEVWRISCGSNGEILIKLKQYNKEIEIYINPENLDEYYFYVDEMLVLSEQIDITNLHNVLQLLSDT